MNKPLGYWSLDYNNELIKDISETWGDYLQNLSEADAYWLIGRIGHELWTNYDTDQPPTAEAEEVIERLHELTDNEKARLIQAIINK